MGTHHHLNFSTIVEGPEQTNQHAELLAATTVVIWAWRPTVIVTDSDWVLQGFLKLKADLATDVRSWSHSALWTLIRDRLGTLPLNTVDMYWTKGHATQEDIDAGHSTLEDKAGNDEADHLATAAAAAHGIPNKSGSNCMAAIEGQQFGRRCRQQLWQKGPGMTIRSGRRRRGETDQLEKTLEQGDQWRSMQTLLQIHKKAPR